MSCRLASVKLYLFPFLSLLLLLPHGADAQIYSPKLLRVGQPDPTDLKKFATAICAGANARTPRERAEAIWRFFLTDGRYVKPGFWYHIAGWTYEEPTGEVLDPIKLLNSYGFGLCYHIAPLLAAVYDAAGFDNARVWFLTGHTVAEVFYDGGYHYFDSDMMGYNVEGSGPFRGKPVVSVHQLETDNTIILGKLLTPKEVKPGVVDTPWYPADVAASAMKDLSDLFTTSKDNYLYPYTRYTPGHSMAFTLRPGEKLIRYFQPEEPGLYYLPYAKNGQEWTEFPKDVPQYQIRVADGPRSQKDGRSWATGRIEYNPPDPQGNKAADIIEMPSPYVVIDAQFQMNAELASPRSSMLVETSSTGGQTWDRAGELKGPHQGTWQVAPRILVTSAHGHKTAVTGTYGYKVRITKCGELTGTHLSSLHLVTRFQVNRRALPYVTAGKNDFTFSTGAPEERLAIPTQLADAPANGFRRVEEASQEFLLPVAGHTGTIVYKLNAGASELTGFDAGARFLQLKDGLAPDKLTAETRHTAAHSAKGTASLAWSTSPEGPFTTVWGGPSKLTWLDNHPIDRLLIWPEVLRQVRNLPTDTRTVYVKFSSSGPAIDSIRLALYRKAAPPSGSLTMTQVWTEDKIRHQHTETIAADQHEHQFTFSAGAHPINQAVIFEAKQ